MGKQLTVKLEKQSLEVRDDFGLLKSNNILQLISWGFTKAGEGKIFEIHSPDIDGVFIRLLEYFKNKNIAYVLTPATELLLKVMFNRRQEFKQLKDRAANFKNGSVDNKDFNKFMKFISKNIARDLKEHQIKASYFQSILGNSANFSVPGSGKTATTLTNYQKLKLEGKANILFVIGPPACFGPWKKEFELTLGYSPKVKILSGESKSRRKFTYLLSESQDVELFLISFHASFNDRDEIKEFFQREDVKPLVVIDEAHYLKQIGGNWSKAILSFAKYASFRCVLTGTPMPKSYSDMFNLFEFLWPEQNVIDNETKISIQRFEKNNNIQAAKENMRDCMGSLFYRVRKSDLGLLEPNFNPPIIVSMNKYERLIYDAILTRIRHYAKDDYLRNIEIVDRLRKGRIIRLRQCLSYAKLLLTAIDGYRENLVIRDSDILKVIKNYDALERPAKCDALMLLIKKLKTKNEKIIVWANFVKTLEKLFREIKSEKINCKIIYGKTPIVTSSIRDEETREKIIGEFLDKNSGLNVLLANPAACAESISLHKTCHYAVYYDLSYNCAQYLQSLDRIHRVGGSETNLANYYFLQYGDTIDFDIKNNLDMKAQKMMDFIEEDYAVYSLDMFEDDNGDLEAYKRLFGDSNV
jgi:SNF2 family DNA or RNA helicase